MCTCVHGKYEIRKFCLQIIYKLSFIYLMKYSQFMFILLPPTICLEIQNGVLP